MRTLSALSFGFRRRLPVVLQSESGECGLACLAMVSSFHGYHTDLAELRRRYSVSLKGATLADIIRVADQLQLGSRPLKLDLDGLEQLRRPCILHMSFNHFVVLKQVSGKSFTIHDPVSGVRVLTLGEISETFTGVALELWPNPAFESKIPPPTVALSQLIGRVTGLWKSFGQVATLALALELFTLVNPLFLKWIVDEVIVSSDIDLLTTLAIGFSLLLILRVSLGAVRSWMLMHLSTLVSVQWRANVFTHLLRLPLQYFQKRHLGDVRSRFASIDQIQSTLTTSFIEAILDGLMSVATVAMMYLYSPMLATIAVVTLLLYAGARWAWYAPLRAATRSQIVFAARQDSYFLETVRGVRTIKLFQREEQRRSAWLSILVDQINAGLRTQRLQIVYRSFNSLLMGFETLLIIWLGARMALDGAMTVGALMAFKAYNDQFTDRLSSLIDKLLQFQLLRTHGERLADVVLTEVEPPKDLSAVDGQAILEPTVTVADLEFSYSDFESPVLQGISFHIAAGESVAIVGPSGCGKSTLVAVLLGLLRPTAGEIYFGGVNVRQVGFGALRRSIGSVLQDDSLFAGSIADNISFFDSSPDHQWIEDCARRAAVHNDIAAMPMGYHSLIGDMGTMLSGGQKQRILLARALYKRPQILLMDEATSHMDVEKEREVNAAIREMDITRIVVAHRPETIASADRIITLSGGRIASDLRTEPNRRMFREEPRIYTASKER